MILPGVTRDSILSLCRGHADGSKTIADLPKNLKVSERNLTSELRDPLRSRDVLTLALAVPDIVEASKNGTLKEIFGAGTVRQALFPSLDVANRLFLRPLSSPASRESGTKMPLSPFPAVRTAVSSTVMAVRLSADTFSNSGRRCTRDAARDCRSPDRRDRE